MRGYVAPTDENWYRELHRRAPLDEVNFWTPSGTVPRSLQEGDPFFFKLKKPHNAIAGWGTFAGATKIPDWLAWDSFGVANGVASYDQLRRRLESLRSGWGAAARGPIDVGCIMLVEPVFFDEDEWVRQPDDWKKTTVRGKTYDLTLGEGRRVYLECLQRGAVRAGAIPFVEANEVSRWGRDRVVRPRLGQGTFRLAVTEAYERACAVTTEHSLPVLEAAHIRPFSSGGLHDVSNGLLLRTDIHRLFDRGYVTVTPEREFVVSRRLREDYENGRVYYEMHGHSVVVPRDVARQPSRELLAWHSEEVFLG